MYIAQETLKAYFIVYKAQSLHRKSRSHQHFDWLTWGTNLIKQDSSR